MNQDFFPGKERVQQRLFYQQAFGLMERGKKLMILSFSSENMPTCGNSENFQGRENKFFFLLQKERENQKLPEQPTAKATSLILKDESC